MRASSTPWAVTAGTPLPAGGRITRPARHPAHQGDAGTGAGGLAVDAGRHLHRLPRPACASASVMRGGARRRRRPPAARWRGPRAARRSKRCSPWPKAAKANAPRSSAIEEEGRPADEGAAGSASRRRTAGHSRRRGLRVAAGRGLAAMAGVASPAGPGRRGGEALPLDQHHRDVVLAAGLRWRRRSAPARRLLGFAGVALDRERIACEVTRSERPSLQISSAASGSKRIW